MPEGRKGIDNNFIPIQRTAIAVSNLPKNTPESQSVASRVCGKASSIDDI